jgi:hypothetical protein
LITKEEFFYLQNLRSERLFSGARARKGTEVPNLFSGLVKCGYCGSTMILAGGSAQRIRSEDGNSVTRPGKKVLVCDGARRGLGCFAVQWPYKDFESSFLTFCRTIKLKEILSDVDAAEGEKDRQLSLAGRLQSVESAINDASTRLSRLMDALELGDAPAAVLKRIGELEHEVEILGSSKTELERELLKVQLSAKRRTDEVETIRATLEMLDGLGGDTLFMVRARITEHIRHLIEIVRVFPAGTLTSPEDIQALRAELGEGEFCAAQVEAYISEHMRTEPKRTGRGVRGRYVTRKDTGRYFTIKARNGGFRVVYPDFDDPTHVAVEMGTLVG